MKKVRVVRVFGRSKSETELCFDSCGLGRIIVRNDPFLTLRGILLMKLLYLYFLIG